LTIATVEFALSARLASLPAPAGGGRVTAPIFPASLVNPSEQRIHGTSSVVALDNSFVKATVSRQ
jgi:hypothetical protein